MKKGFNGDFDVGVALARIGQDLNAMIKKLGRTIVVVIVGVIELDSRRAGIARDLFDCQVRRRYLKPIPALSKAAPGQQEKTNQKKIAMAFDHSDSSHRGSRKPVALWAINAALFATTPV